MSADRTPGRPGGRVGERRRDDEGGLWIRVGIVFGVLFYGFMVVLWAAGFTAVVPFVIIPLVLVALIGSNALLGGPRRRRQLDPRPIGPTDRGADPSTHRPGTPSEEPTPAARMRPPDHDGAPPGHDGGEPGAAP